MDRSDTLAEVERLLNLHRTIREPAQLVYELTEVLLDALPDGARNSVADNLANRAYDELLLSDRLIELARNLFTVRVYPSYPPVNGFWSRLEKRSDEQKQRLDHHLRFVCLRDYGELIARRNAAESVIDGMLEIYRSRDVLFYMQERNLKTGELTNGDVRLFDGVVELSIKFVETIAGVVRDLTRIAPGPEEKAPVQGRT